MASRSNPSQPDPGVERPQFAVVLGLLPPYTLDDVKRAYLDKVKQAHPDHGGSRDDFDRLQQAYEQAGAYLRFRSDRRQWIAARMDEYLSVMQLVERLGELGAEVDTDTLDWLQRSFGDFADLTESIAAIRLRRPDHVEEVVAALVREQTILPALKRLDLAGAPVSDALALELRVFKGLTHLDLSRTSISDRALALLDWLPELRQWRVDGTSIGWWSRRRLKRKLAQRNRAKPDPVLHPVNIR